MDPSLIRHVSHYATTELTALATLFGGIVAHECMKYTGIYIPINQWMHYDAFELLSDMPPMDATPVGSRYDHQITLFGTSMQAKLAQQHVFLVGCGPLGCEYLKGITLMGIGIHGAIHVADDADVTHRTRTCLLGRRHMGRCKATCAAAEAAVRHSMWGDRIHMLAVLSSFATPVLVSHPHDMHGAPIHVLCIGHEPRSRYHLTRT